MFGDPAEMRLQSRLVSSDRHCKVCAACGYCGAFRNFLGATNAFQLWTYCAFNVKILAWSLHERRAFTKCEHFQLYGSTLAQQQVS